MNELISILAENFWILLLILVLSIDKRFRIGAVVLLFIQLIITRYANISIWLWLIISSAVMFSILISYALNNNYDSYFESKYKYKNMYKYKKNMKISNKEDNKDESIN